MTEVSLAAQIKAEVSLAAQFQAFFQHKPAHWFGNI